MTSEVTTEVHGAWTKGLPEGAVWAAFGFVGSVRVQTLQMHPTVMRVQDGRGDWVVKRTGMVLSDAGAIDRWVRTVRARGAPVVVAAAGFGENPRLLADGCWWVAYPFVAGEAYAGTAEQMREAGALLSHLHVAGAFNDWGLRTMAGAPVREWAWVRRQAAAAAEAMQAAGLDGSGLMARAEALWQAGEVPRGLPMAGGSVDFKVANLVFVTERTVERHDQGFAPGAVLIDPDGAAYLPRIYDLAVAALLFHADRGLERMLSRAEWDVFMTGYGRIVVLNALERAAWPEMVRLAWLDQGLWLLAHSPDGWGDGALRELAAADLERFAV